MTVTVDPPSLLLARFDAAMHRALPAAVDALWPADAPISGLVLTRYNPVPPACKARPARTRGQ